MISERATENKTPGVEMYWSKVDGHVESRTRGLQHDAGQEATLQTAEPRARLVITYCYICYTSWFVCLCVTGAVAPRSENPRQPPNVYQKPWYPRPPPGQQWGGAPQRPVVNNPYQTPKPPLDNRVSADSPAFNSGKSETILTLTENFLLS